MLIIPPALAHRNYRLLWLGLLVSFAGSQMQLAAVHWHIREITGTPDPLALGGIGLARILPVLVFSTIGGVVADTFERRKIIFITQTVMALVALALAGITFGGQAQIWHIYLLTAIQGAANAFDLPARQAMVPNLVPGKDLPNAFSLNAIASNAGAVGGPVLGGIVIATLGTGYTYLINAISFGAVLLALLLMRNVPQDLRTPSGINLAAIWDGIKFIFNKKLILATMITDFFATFFASANTMMPIVARDWLNVGEVGYGWLMSGQAIGSVAVGLLFSQLGELRNQGRLFLAAVAVFGISTILFGLSGNFLFTMFTLIIMGAADAVSTIIRNTIRQLATPDSIRGRMTSINQIFFMGGPQLGEVEAGVVGALFGIQFAVVSGGVGVLIALAIIVAKFPVLTQYNSHQQQSHPPLTN